MVSVHVHVHVDGSKYLVDSKHSSQQYEVIVLPSHCFVGKDCIPHCVEEKCDCLCRHMVSCTCYDFKHGHLCKHSHKVHMMHQEKNSTECGGVTDVIEKCGVLQYLECINHMHK